jgi:glycosyltransferase involved in cell wall biosynthesis
MHSLNNSRIAIISTHPIQYNAPLFQELAKLPSIKIKVFYTWYNEKGNKYDPGFGKHIEWDIPLLNGYDYTFVKNSSRKPGSDHYNGIKNPSLVSEIEKWDPDNILIYGWNFQSHLQVMRYFKGKIPILFRGDSTLLDYDFQSLHDLITHYRSLLTRNKSQITNHKSQITNLLSSLFSFLKFSLRRIYLTHIYLNIDKAFYVGTHNKIYYLTHGLKEDQLIYMPHAVENEFFSHDDPGFKESALEWRRSLGIADTDFVVLFAGKFEPKKNPELLVNAIISLNELSPPLGEIKRGLHLILVGNGILEQNLLLLYREKPYIHFLPFQNQSRMPVVYRLANVFCLPSKGPGESWGLAVNEAMASGVAVIVSDKAGCAIDLVENGKNGFIFKSSDQKDLASKLKMIMSMDLKKMGDHSKTMIQSWSVQKAANLLVKNL